MNNVKKNKLYFFLFKIKHRIKNVLKVLGPGFVTGSADDDPSGIGTYSIAGAQYGLKLLWLIPLQLPLMYAMQNMCARIGLVTNRGLAANMKAHFPKWILYITIFILTVASTINIGADLSIIAASINLLIGGDIYIWATITTIIVVLMEIYISYRIYSKILLLLCCFLFAYAITAFMTTKDWLEVLQFSFIPHVEWNKEFWLVATGFIGTTISPYLFFWQASQEIEEKQEQKKNRKFMKQMPIDTFIGMFFSQLMSLFIVLTCYTTLHKHNITQIASAHDAAQALRPIAGDFAYLVFSLGIIGSGLLGIPVLAGSSAYALAELFSKPEGLSRKFNEARFFYGVIGVSTVVGLFMHFIGINPFKALLYAAVINCWAAIPIVILVLILANKKDLMGIYRNNLFLNAMGAFTFILMSFTSILMVIYM